MNTGYFPSDLEGSIKGVIGLQVWEMGRILGASLRGSLSLCSQPTEGDDRISEPPKQAHTLPLPTHRELVSPLLLDEFAGTIDWVIAVCMALKSIWGCQRPTGQERGPAMTRSSMSGTQARIIEAAAREVAGLQDIREVTKSFDGEKTPFGTRTDCRLHGGWPFRFDGRRSNPLCPERSGLHDCFLGCFPNPKCSLWGQSCCSMDFL